jgi:hypothetical protein
VIRPQRMGGAAILLWGPLLVGGRAVEGGDGDVVEAEIDAELRSVVDEMVEAQTAEAERAGIVGDDLVAVAKLPRSGEVLVAGGRQGGAAFGGTFVELLESVLACREFQRHVRAFGVGHVHTVIYEDVVAEHSDGGAVHGEFAEGHGFVMTLPVVFSFGYALEGAAGVGYLDVVVLKEDFSDGHRCSLLELLSVQIMLVADDRFGRFPTI